MSRLVTDHLPLLAGAPNGVKKLRGLILELAVRGKLVAQDSGDSAVNYDGEDGWPFSLPSAWRWCALRDLQPDFQNGASSRGDPDGDSIVVLRLADIRAGEIDLTNVRNLHLNASAVEKYRLNANDILVIRVNGSADLVGRFISCQEDIDAIYCDHFIRLRLPRHLINARFLQIASNSKTIRSRIQDLFVTTAGQKTVNQGHIGSLPIPLPPSAEQNRIIAKVDELMALCDRLENSQSDAQAAHARLVDELLGSLLQARDAEDFAECWGRVKGSFNVLFTTEHSLVLLKQAILQFGVMGLLVEESTAESNSSFELLKAISAENGKIVLIVQPTWKTPSAWAWTQLTSILVYGPKNGISPKPVSHATPVRCLTLGATTRGQFNESCYKFVDLDPVSAQKYLLKSGDLLIQRANSIDYVGVSAIYNGQDDVFIFPDLMMRMRVTEQMFLPFVHMCLSALPCREYLRSRATGTQGNMPKVNQGTVSETPIPVPPIEVQQRIVAKVDELMALCDRIKANLARLGELNERLAGTLVERAVL